MTKMKQLGISMTVFVLILLQSCNKSDLANQYKFKEEYCTTVTVGGIVGIEEMCFEKEEIVKAESVTDTSIFVRIAEHTTRNDSQGPWNYQELVEVPKEYIRIHRGSIQ